MKKLLCSKIFQAVLFGAIVHLATLNVSAQPYIDLVNARYTNSPNSGTGDAANVPVKMQYFNFSTNLPIRFKKTGDAILLMPFVESWKISWPNNEYRNYSVRGYALPVGFLKNISHGKMTIVGVFIPRINMEKTDGQAAKNFFQYGAYVLGSFKVNEKLTLKAGGYYNREFFGPHFIPLVGVDWKINEKSNLFGTLPNQLVYERKINRSIYFGGITRFITNSYRLVQTIEENFYLRIDENQLGGFVDFYPSKKIVINLELGHSVLRKIRQGAHDQKLDLSSSLTTKDNFYGKISLAYRLRFR